MLNPTICPQCFQPNEPARTLCWKCMRGLAVPANEKDYERIFELHPSWGVSDLKTAFRRLAMKYHPDVNHGDREADAYFKFVNQAYEVLSRLGNQTTPASAASPSAPAQEAPAKPAQEIASDELYQKLAAVIHESRTRNAGPVKPKSFLHKLAHWFSK